MSLTTACIRETSEPAEQEVVRLKGVEKTVEHLGVGFAGDARRRILSVPRTRVPTVDDHAHDRDTPCSRTRHALEDRLRGNPDLAVSRSIMSYIPFP